MTLQSADENSVLNVLPVGMHNSALVLKDEDGDSVIADLEELSCGSEPNLVPAAINVENSSDVIIGPVTQFNGPVTIYQNVTGGGSTTPSLTENGSANTYLNGKLVKSESASSDSVPYSADKSTKGFLDSKHVKYIGFSLLALVILATIATVTVISLKPRHSPKADQPSDIIDEDGGLKLAGPGIIVEKQQWGGRPALNGTKPLHHPTPFVVISHTATPTCSNFDACSKRVQSIQSYHVAHGSPDIGYNFVIGGDGNAYVGRGWDTANFHGIDSIGISFIGNYLFDSLTPDMIDIAKKLIEEGVKTGKLAEAYKLIGHKQMYATESPGANVMNEIKKWPHYDPERYIPT